MHIVLLDGVQAEYFSTSIVKRPVIGGFGDPLRAFWRHNNLSVYETASCYPFIFLVIFHD